MMTDIITFRLDCVPYFLRSKAVALNIVLVVLPLQTSRRVSIGSNWLLDVGRAKFEHKHGNERVVAKLSWHIA